ncbi:MAG: polyhydroxyalkanoic acid system family protein [Myxococcaceae bacterium]|nr:polyhydroxyalkanoic acid system family protein [Myxococcaceae bacterium]
MLRGALAIVASFVVLSATPASADDRIFFHQHHTFSRAEARIRIQQLLDYWQERFGVTRYWIGDVAHISGRVMGVEFNGQVVVKDGEVSAETSDPGGVFRSAAIEYVRKKLRKYLNPAYQEN